ncbi:MAG: SUMF1/EgtB/PvdO family nonheme iron enzyme [Verrucomicrobia bacterium]|nr:SUMF1/EgtB/PvdO family nonheme iron enzyme [Verrucomicrobiota bacterium]
MKTSTFVIIAALGVILKTFHTDLSGASAGDTPFRENASFVFENESEFIASGDFNGDGLPDVVIVEKSTGKYRLGYQRSDGGLSWAGVRLSGITAASGFSVGRLITPNRDALVLTAPDLNAIAIMDAANLSIPADPVSILAPLLGPNAVVAIPVGGGEANSRDDLFVAGIYNDPAPSQVFLMRNEGAEFTELTNEELSGVARRANRISLGLNGPEFACMLIAEPGGDTFRIVDVRSGSPKPVLTIPNLPSRSAYAIARFADATTPSILFFVPGESSLTVYPITNIEGSEFGIGHKASVDFGTPLAQVFPLQTSDQCNILVLHGTGERGGIYAFDGKANPKLLSELSPPQGFSLRGAVVLQNRFVALAGRSGPESSSLFRSYPFNSRQNLNEPYDELPTLDHTVFEIHAQITARCGTSPASEMQPYTRIIPGTQTSYTMIPIPGGEFLMGSHENEAKRNSDEGPQHRVRIEPFWMGKYEVTWNEYELFIYPDTARMPSDPLMSYPNAIEVSDAVTHPSKPYTEMSFGMGKDGYPAISMTQHGANKYCQWLSARTGEFYRLPTEAEWEYACRAGTTTAYYFGDDPTELTDHAWFGMNSDWKYQKVGKKGSSGSRVGSFEVRMCV